MAKGKKTGGRDKGTPNKTTQEVRERFQMLLENNMHSLQADLDQLEPLQRLKIMMDMAKLVVPPPQPEPARNVDKPIFTGIDMSLPHRDKVLREQEEQ